MNKFLILFLALLPFHGNTQLKTAATPKAVAEKGFVITAQVSGLKKGTVVKLVNANTSAEIASTTVMEKTTRIIKNGKAQASASSYFILRGSVSEPDLCMLAIGEMTPYNMYVENSKISISGTADAMGKWSVKGSASHKDFQEFETTFTPLAQQLNSLASSINSMGAGTSRDSLMGIYTKTQQTIQDKIDEFINNKKNSYVSPFVLLVMRDFNNDPVLAETRFNKLTATVQVSYLGKILSGQIASSKIGAIGTQALEFTQPDTSGNPVSLSSFRGKYVLVDFWASWCGPCRTENPTVVYNYQKFKDKNFTVLGVSLDRPGQKDKWLQAIKDDNLTWTHVSDLQFWNNEAAKLYNIQGIPQNILVDPAGKIIAKNLRGPALEAKLCELFGCN